MTLTNPVFLHPIVIPAGYDTAGALIKLNTSTNVTLVAGTYYWCSQPGTSTPGDGSFGDMLVAALNAAMGGTWVVELTAAWRLSITYTGASTPTTLDFQSLDVLAPYMFGSTLTKTTASLSFTSKAFTSTYQPRWLWRPNEPVIDDQVKPVAANVVATSEFDGSALIDNYGEYFVRTCRMEAVRGARVWQWAADDSAFAAEAGEVVGDLHVALESFWRDAWGMAREPGVMLYLADGEAGWATWAWQKVQWVDSDQIKDLDEALDELSTEPYQITVTMRILDLQLSGAA